MIIGIGTDILDIARIERTFGRHGIRFAKRCFSSVEQKECARRVDVRAQTAYLARRFAAKEAVVKALGTGVQAGVFLRDIRVENNAQGAPFVTLSGGAARRLADLTPPGHHTRIHLSLSDEQDRALAFVVIEALVA